MTRESHLSYRFSRHGIAGLSFRVGLVMNDSERLARDIIYQKFYMWLE